MGGEASATRRRLIGWGVVAMCATAGAPGAAVALATIAADAIDPARPTRFGWLVSLGSELVPQAFAASIVAAVISAGCALVMRRRGARALRAVVAVLVAVVLVLGWQAGRVPRAPWGDGSGSDVLVMAVNAHARNHEPAGIVAALLDAKADVVMLNEPSMNLIEALASDPRIGLLYPHTTRIAGAGPGYRHVLSRHRLVEGEAAFGTLWPGLARQLTYHGQRLVRVEMPAGPLVFAGVHFLSPRDPNRWAAGNAEAEAFAQSLATVAEEAGAPVILAGDLNSTPTGARSRRLARQAGLQRTKPLFRFGGTFPAGMPASLSIDGVLVSPGVGVLDWRVVALPGSDHDGILVRLQLPRAFGSSSP